MRRILLSAARRLDSWTRVLDPLKYRLGLTKWVRQLLLPKVATIDCAQIRDSLDSSYVQRSIDALEADGCRAPHFFVLCVEGLGDVIAAEPVARALKKMSPQGTVSWVVKAGCEDLVRHNPSIDEVIGVESLWAGYALCKKRELESGNIFVNCHFDGWRCSTTGKFLSNPVNPQINVDNSLAITHILGGFSAAAGLPILDEAPQFHLSPAAGHPDFGVLPYVVMHCRSKDADKNWGDGNFNRLAGFIVGKGVPVVEIGTEKVVHSSSPLYHDFTGRQSFQSLGAAIRDASLFIGVDSCFAHVSNAFKRPSIVLQGLYRQYFDYQPYSGGFARSRLFRIVRPERRGAASGISFDTVARAAAELLPKTGHANKVAHGCQF